MKGFDRSINVPNARVPSRFFIKWVMLACYLALGLLVSVGSTSAAITDSPAPQLPAWSNSSTSVNALAFDPTGVFLAGARDDGRITLWNTSTAGSVRELSSTSSAAVTGLALSPDGTILGHSRRRHKGHTLGRRLRGSQSYAQRAQGIRPQRGFRGRNNSCERERRRQR